MTYRSSTVNMVDCGNLRCFQERRLIKKELTTWSKKIPLLVGLETIAEHVGSRRKVRKLFEPFNCLESKPPPDWEPEENCFYCKDREAVEKAESKDSGKVLKEHPRSPVLRHLGDTLPYLPQLYPSEYGREQLPDVKAAAPDNPEPPAQVPSPAPKTNVELNVPSVANSPPAKAQKKDVPSPSNTSSKKPYSNIDLSAAVTEVKNGKMGTRRAASLYGVPRSTLRNKVFKTDTEDSMETSASHEEEFMESLVAAQRQMSQQLNTQDTPMMLTELMEMSSLQYLAPFAMPYFMNPEMLMLPYLEESEWERKLEAIRHKHNISRASMNHYKVKALSSHKFRPYQCELIKKLTQERMQQEMESHNSRTSERDTKHDTHEHFSLGHPLSSQENSLPPKKRSKKEIPNTSSFNANALMQSALYKALNINHPFVTTLNTSESSSDSDAAMPDFPYFPASTMDNRLSQEGEAERKIYDGMFKYENTRIGDTLKDIIVKTISEKVKCKLESTDFAGLVGASSSHEHQKAKDTIMSAFAIPEHIIASPAKKSRREPRSHGDMSKSSSLASQDQSGATKKTRPKRGQYRKYNSQLLTEAVKAVQRGEMSVHRAGSYYGVPHSTLEYKVKERHLLRQKKIKEQQELKQKQEEEAAKQHAEIMKAEHHSPAHTESSTSTASDLSISSPSKPVPGPSSWLPSFSGAGVPYENAAALGLFGTGFSINTPASELLRKLQHKVQSKSDTRAESPGLSSFPSVPSTNEGYIHIS